MSSRTAANSVLKPRGSPRGVSPLPTLHEEKEGASTTVRHVMVPHAIDAKFDDPSSPDDDRHGTNAGGGIPGNIGAEGPSLGERSHVGAGNDTGQRVTVVNPALTPATGGGNENAGDNRDSSNVDPNKSKSRRKRCNIL